MFEAKIYRHRREHLRRQVQSGLILFLGNEESPMNYPANPYHFRQDSSFLYFFGLDSLGLAAVMDADSGRDMLFGDDIGIEDIIWMGYRPTLKERARQIGVPHVAPMKGLDALIGEAVRKKRKIHFLPPYRPEIVLKLKKLLGIRPHQAKQKASDELIRAVIDQRSVKIKEEIEQIEMALRTTCKMYMAAMKMARTGIYEREIVGRIDGIAIAEGEATAFPTILTINGHILHNHYHGNKLRRGKLLVIDSGAESPMHYASDITRTFPVGGHFSLKQRDIYEIVLKAQEMSIQSIRPGVLYRDIHIQAAKTIAAGLKEVGLMKGDIDEAVHQGAHAIFFPHGIGHMLGLDVHDMEDLGENFVGYNDRIQRSRQFGLAYLRMAKELKPGFVLTVEPGIYFIPALIRKWRREKKFLSFINFSHVDKYMDFGGIRIEDNILVTADGHRVLGKPILKKVKMIEEMMTHE
ncbi:MAG: aminopeptidase P family protein [Candidatus Aminicenantales bacterium]